MKPCLNPSIIRTRELTEYLNIAKRTGYEYVDVDTHQLEQYDWATVRELFLERKLQVGSFGLPVDVYADESTFQADLEKLRDRASLAMSLGAKSCCTWLWPSIDELPVPYAARLAKRFRAIATVLSAYGIRLGLEFVGPHHLRNKTYPFVYTMQDTLAYIDGIGAPNIGLLLDSYHWYTTEGTESEILSLPVHRIVHVHVNDTDQSPALALDGERLFPGEGIIDLSGFFKALQQIRYTGPVSIEVLHKEPFLEDDERVAKKAFDSVQRILSEVK
jgi:sugar phosphate isomerase/epimerase